MREALAADLGEFGIGCKVREVDLDAHDLIHVGVELAQGLANAIEGDAHFLLEADGLVVRWDRHAHLTRDEHPAAGFGIDTQRLAEALRDRVKRSEEHTSELQSHLNLVCRLLLEKKKE